MTFDNVAKAVGLTLTHVNGASPEKSLVETMGSGAAFLDYDNDGSIDLFVVDGGSIATAGKCAPKHRLFHNDGKGNFTDVTAASGIVHREYGIGACAGDVDGDGRTDLYVTNCRPNVLYRNAGNGAFTDITRTARVGLNGWSTSCAFLDVDRDGDLNLFIANYLDAPPSKNPFCGDPQRRIRVYCHPLNYTGLPSVLYRNDGKGVFTDVSAEAGISKYVGNGLGVAVGNYDDDGLPDVFVANDAVPNFLFHNDGKGRFSEVGLAAGVCSWARRQAARRDGDRVQHYNGDGRLDLVVTNHEFETHSLFATTARARSRMRQWKPASHADAAIRSDSASRSSMPTTTGRSTCRSSTDTSSTTPPCSDRAVARTAPAAVSEHERAAIRRNQPPGRPWLRGADRRTHAHHRRLRQRRRRQSRHHEQRWPARRASQ